MESAFPVPDGMTLRDYIAAKAMAAIIAKLPLIKVNEQNRERDEMVAIGAYAYADSMLAERDRK